MTFKAALPMKFALLGLYYNTINSKYKYKIQYIDINKLTTPAKAIHLARTININSFKL